MRFCDQCGAPLTDGVSFCRVCGHTAPQAFNSAPNEGDAGDKAPEIGGAFYDPLSGSAAPAQPDSAAPAPFDVGSAPLPFSPSGSGLTDSSAPSDPFAPTAHDAPSAAPFAAAGAQKAAAAPAQPQKDKKKPKGLTIALIAAAVVLIGAVVAVLAIAGSRGKNHTEAAAPAQEAQTVDTEAADPAPAAAAATRVEFELEHAGGKEFARIIGYDDAGSEAWTVETPHYDISQMQRVTGLMVNNGLYYYIDDGDVVALDLTDGSERWRNTNFSGSPASNGWIFGDDGVLYLCGYFGPDFFSVDPSGKTLVRIGELKKDFYWAYDMRFANDGNLRIRFEHAPDEGEGDITVNPANGTIVSVTGDQDASAKADLPTAITLTASSTLRADGYDYSASRAMDGNNATAWVEGSNGDGCGETLTLDFGRDCTVSGMRIWPGYHKSESLFFKNNRPQRIRLRFSDGSTYEAELTDSMTMQTLDFGGNITTSSITITILSVYPGSAYNDLCISEIELF